MSDCNFLRKAMIFETIRLSMINNIQGGINVMYMLVPTFP